MKATSDCLEIGVDVPLEGSELAQVEDQLAQNYQQAENQQVETLDELDIEATQNSMGHMQSSGCCLNLSETRDIAILPADRNQSSGKCASATRDSISVRQSSSIADDHDSIGVQRVLMHRQVKPTELECLDSLAVDYVVGEAGHVSSNTKSNEFERCLVLHRNGSTQVLACDAITPGFCVHESTLESPIAKVSRPGKKSKEQLGLDLPNKDIHLQPYLETKSDSPSKSPRGSPDSMQQTDFSQFSSRPGRGIESVFNLQGLPCMNIPDSGQSFSSTAGSRGESRRARATVQASWIDSIPVIPMILGLFGGKSEHL